MARYIDADKLKPDTKTFISAYSEELIEFYSQKAIDNAPTVDVSPVVHAYWTEKRFPGGGFWDNSFVCSHCHHETPVRGYPIAPDYCPGCGAKMDGKDGEQNAKT